MFTLWQGQGRQDDGPGGAGGCCCQDDSGEQTSLLSSGDTEPVTAEVRPEGQFDRQFAD